MKVTRSHIRALCSLVLMLFAPRFLPCALGQQNSSPWVGTWGLAPVAQNTSGSNALTFHQQTLRQIVHTSVGGSIARVRISNAFGTGPLTVEDVWIALSANNSNSSIIASSEVHITFQGSSLVSIPAGAEAISDATNFPMPTLGDVAISMYFPGTTSVSTATTHLYTEETNFYASGDVSSQTSLSGATAIGQYYFLAGLDVQGASFEGSFVTIGASITDGFASSYLQNHRWPNYLAQRFNAAGMEIGVLNEGISGNQMLTDNGTFGVTPEHRFNRDVLTQPGVHWMVLSDDPINDLGDNSQATATELIAAIQQLMNQAHQVQFKFLCSTLTPYKGASYWTSNGETNREQINAFIRSSSSGCDGVIDQDAAVHDPNNPQAYLPAYDSGDHLHPNDAGYQAIANAVNLALFTPPPQEAPFGGNPAAVPGTVQAENYDAGGQGTGFYVTSINGMDNGYRPDGVDLEITSAPGGGNDVGWTTAGQWFRFTVNVATAGTYAVTFEVASPAGVTDGFHLSSSTGTNLTGSVNIPVTGGWQTWTTVTATVTLPAGQQVLTWNQDNAGYNFYSAAFASTASCTTVPSVPTGLGATAVSSSQINLTWTASTAGTGCSITYSVFRSTTSGFTAGTGNQIASGLTTTTFSNTGLAASTTYYYVVEAVDAAGASPQSNQANATTSASTGPCTSICIDSGSTTAVSPFVADKDFSGGATIDHANTINTSKVTNPAPAAVYQTARVTATAGAGTTFSYTIGGFTAGSMHTVRLHFCETYWTAAGKRQFNVSINGTQVLTKFDIFATAGGQNIANIQQFTEAANASGQYVLTFTSDTDKALISGIEID
jgi:lysophospholipase L1-like esterase